MRTISAPALTGFATELLCAAGVPRDEAVVVATSLVGANLRGHDSHGVMRIPQYVGFVERGEYRIGRGPGGRARDARAGRLRRPMGLGTGPGPPAAGSGHAQGPVAGRRGRAARDCGHIGRLGEYAERAAASGLMLLATVNNGGAGQRVAPPGGHRAPAGHKPVLRRPYRPPTRCADRRRLRDQRRRRGESPRLLHQQATRPRGLAAGPPRAADDRSRRPV